MVFSLNGVKQAVTSLKIGVTALLKLSFKVKKTLTYIICILYKYIDIENNEVQHFCCSERRRVTLHWRRVIGHFKVV